MNVCCEAVLVWNWDTVTALCKTGGGDVIGFLTTKCTLQRLTSPTLWPPALYIISVMSVCLTVCQITCESLDIRHSYLYIWYISRECRSDSYMKVIGSGSRSQEQKRLKKSLSPQFTTLNGSNTDSICFRRRRRRLCDVTFVNCASLK